MRKPLWTILLCLNLSLYQAQAFAVTSNSSSNYICKAPEALAPIQDIARIKGNMSKAPLANPPQIWVEKTRQIYELVKIQALKFLQSRTRVENSVMAQAISERVKNSQILVVDDNNVAADALFTNPDANIQIRAWSELANTNPQAIYLLLSHEMGHVMGPTHSFLRNLPLRKMRPEILPYDENYPFNDLVQEVAQKVRGYDYPCMQNRVEEYHQSHPAVRVYGDFLKEAMETMKATNPYVSIDYYKISQGAQCAPQQREEAFADTFAREILKQRSQAGERVSLPQSFAFFCAFKIEEDSHGHTEPDPHPAMVLRIDELLSPL